MKPTLAALSQAAALLAGALVALPATAATDPFDGNWHFGVTPYVWLPNVNANLNYDLPPRVGELLGSEVRRASAEVGPNDYLNNLKFALMLTGEVRKGFWSAFTDIMYMDMGNQGAHVRNFYGPRGEALGSLTHQAESSMSGTIWTLGGGYTLAHGAWGNVDALAGFRYLGIDTELKLQVEGSNGRLERAAKSSSNMADWDGIIGAKGQVLFGNSRWFMPWYVDVGTGSSNWTWQAVLGAGYRFNWGDVTLAVRSLSYEFDKNDADIRFTGPMLGASFHW